LGTTKGIWASTQTRFGSDKGYVGRGNPITGTWNASPKGAGFTFPAAGPDAAPNAKGLRTTSLVGEVGNDYPYIYSYTYGTVYNDQGSFGPGQGPGNFSIVYPNTASPQRKIKVTQGKAKFGGTMKLLGALTTKVCYWLQAGGGGCSLGEADWRYDAIGATAMTNLGVVTGGYIATSYTIYYNTANGQTSPLSVSGARFPWTTGSVTVTAVGRGPHKTVHYAHGYDNRNTTTSLGKGTIQLVSPVLTRWFGYANFETGGIGVLRIKFIPEPQTWAMLVAGVSLLALSTRMRGR
jgi:hypothetical protein